jgi:catechol 2,3-dioxygenase-like lactoylglutathione lyase family enzyme
MMSRVTEIRHVAYGVADFEAERRFYADNWGLDEVRAADDKVWFRAAGQEEPYVVRLHQSGSNHVEVIALAAGSRSDVDALFDRVQQAGLRIVHAPRDLTSPGGGHGFRFFSPDGLPLEISSDVERAPVREVTRAEAVPVRISHVVLHSPDLKKQVAFFTDVLGFRVSDWLGDFMCFLRCNSAHHRIALLPGPPCLNHVAYDMTGLDGMLRGIGRLKSRGIDVRWGPGRHTAGDNTFSYFVTPNGFAVEYTAELETVDFEKHVDRVHVPSPQILDQWGIGVGGPHVMPHPKPDPHLFRPAAD